VDFVDGYWDLRQVHVGGSDSSVVLRDSVDIHHVVSVTSRFMPGRSIRPAVRAQPRR